MCKTAFVILSLWISALFSNTVPKLYTKEEKSMYSKALAQIFWYTMEDYKGGYDFEEVITTLQALYQKKLKPGDLSNCYLLLSESLEKKINYQARQNLKKADAYFMKLHQDPSNIPLVKHKLYYKILVSGEGPPLNQESIPLIQFTEKTISGDILKTSNHPIRIPLIETLPGFRQGVEGMKPGEKRKIFVHPELAYGELSRKEPNLMIIFEVELLSLNEAPPKRLPLQ